MDVLFKAYKAGEDPFAEEPLPPAHYHPSTQKQLSVEEKQLKLAASQRNKTNTAKTKSSHTKPDPSSYASPGERQFLQGTNKMLAKELPTHDTPSPRDLSTKFDESWPTSERPSTIESPSDISTSQISSKLSSLHLRGPSSSSSALRGLPNDGLSTTSRESWRSLLPKQQSPAKDTTLAKYIHRFRYSEPKSREERKQEKQRTSSKEFWWMSPPSDSSTPTDECGMKRISHTSQAGQRSPLGAWRAGRQSRRSEVSNTTSSSVSSYKLPKAYSTAPSSSSFHSSVLDEDTAQLQAKANKLLEQSESTLTSEPLVSSEGVGLSPSTEESLFIPHVPNIPPDSHYHATTSSYQTNLRPEDDILHQWRVRRRLEQARQGSQDIMALRLNPVEPFSPSVHSKEPDVDGNSTLERFRKRLKQQQLSTQSRTSFAVSQKEPVSHIGTDPIPQSISTQTNGMLPSTKNVQERTQAINVSEEQHRSNDMYGLEQDRPVRDSTVDNLAKNIVYGGPRKETWGTHDTNALHIDRQEKDDQITNKNLIASPHIVRTKAPDRGRSIVAPHLHMECDIIPCDLTAPHMHDEDAITKHRDLHKSKQQQLQQNMHEQFPRQRLNFDQESPQTPPQRLAKDDDKVIGDDAVNGAHEKVRGERLPRNIVPDSPVTSAIGQVISSRLFTSTPTPASISPDSSIDTLPSMQHSQTAQSDTSAVTHDTGESTSSDGEFEEDELLQMLRRRRAEFEQELQRLDQLIQNKQ